MHVIVITNNNNSNNSNNSMITSSAYLCCLKFGMFLFQVSARLPPILTEIFLGPFQSLHANAQDISLS
jgi:hypothetical protein